MSKSVRFHALDSFRGLCALSVVVFHMHIADSFTKFEFFRNAGIFVDFFFVLSGFVIAHSCLSKKTFCLPSFLLSRIFRIVPLHVFVLLVFLVIELGKFFAYKSGIVFSSIPFTEANHVSEIIPNLLLLQSWTYLTNNASFNYPSWTISIEFYTYLVFGFVFLLAPRFRALTVLLIPILMFSLITLKVDAIPMAVLQGASCFFSGVITYVIYKKTFSKINVTFAMFSIIEVISISLSIFSVLVGFNVIILCLIFCVTVFVFAFEGGFISGFLKSRPLLMLGELSYSIYLNHAAILLCNISLFIILQKLTGIEFTFFEGGMRNISLGHTVLNNILGIFLLCVVLLASRFTFVHVELKWQVIGKRLTSSYKKKSKESGEQCVSRR